MIDMNLIAYLWAVWQHLARTHAEQLLSTSGPAYRV